MTTKTEAIRTLNADLALGGRPESPRVQVVSAS
jgi:hypothetical protein